jgi:O-antigen ligase
VTSRVLAEREVTMKGRHRTARPATRAGVEHASVVLLLAYWAFPLAHDFGGRGAISLSWALLSGLPALLLTRPWARFPLSCLCAGAVSVSALLVCVFAPTGWAGSDAAAGYVYAALTAVVVLSYCRSDRRRIVVAVAIAVAGIDQCLHGLQPWIGGGDPTVPLVGTFYWRNPFAAYLLAPAVLGVALAVAGTNRAVRALGWVAAAFGVAGIVLSSSRASLAVLVVAMVVLAVAALRTSWRTGLRVAAVVLFAGLATLALPGPPWFTHWHSPFSALADRSAAGETIASNGEYRTEFWREAINGTQAHPLTGGGYHSLATESEYTSPASWARSPLAHNGYLQAASDGGALLAVPFGVGSVALGIAALSVVRRSRLRMGRQDALPLAAAVAGLGLLAHSFVDFDWSHPALFAMTAMTLCLAASSSAGRTPRRMPRRIGVGAVAALLACAIVAIPALRAWADTDRVAHDGRARPALAAGGLLSRGEGPFGDYRGAAALLRHAAADEPVGAASLLQAWQRTARVAGVDPEVAALRARALLLLGRPAASIAAAGTLLATLGAGRDGAVAANVAVTLGRAGEPERAHQLLAPLLRFDLAGSTPTRAWLDVAAAEQAGLLTDAETGRCLLAAATEAAGPAPAGVDVPEPASTPVGSDCSRRLALLTR